MKDIDYSRFLTSEDKIRITFRKKHGKIEYFIVQYSALINSRWRAIMRFDTCHGYAHKHTFHLRSREYIINLTDKGDGLNDVFTEASIHIQMYFLKIKENFLKN